MATTLEMWNDSVERANAKRYAKQRLEAGNPINPALTDIAPTGRGSARRGYPNQGVPFRTKTPPAPVRSELTDDSAFVQDLPRDLVSLRDAGMRNMQESPGRGMTDADVPTALDDRYAAAFAPPESFIDASVEGAKNLYGGLEDIAGNVAAGQDPAAGLEPGIFENAVSEFAETPTGQGLGEVVKRFGKSAGQSMQFSKEGSRYRYPHGQDLERGVAGAPQFRYGYEQSEFPSAQRPYGALAADFDAGVLPPSLEPSDQGQGQGQPAGKGKTKTKPAEQAPSLEEAAFEKYGAAGPAEYGDGLSGPRRLPTGAAQTPGGLVYQEGESFIPMGKANAQGVTADGRYDYTQDQGQKRLLAQADARDVRIREMIKANTARSDLKSARYALKHAKSKGEKVAALKDMEIAQGSLDAIDTRANTRIEGDALRDTAMIDASGKAATASQKAAAANTKEGRAARKEQRELNEGVINDSITAGEIIPNDPDDLKVYDAKVAKKAAAVRKFIRANFAAKTSIGGPIGEMAPDEVEAAAKMQHLGQSMDALVKSETGIPFFNAFQDKFKSWETSADILSNLNMIFPDKATPFSRGKDLLVDVAGGGTEAVEMEDMDGKARATLFDLMSGEDSPMRNHILTAYGDKRSSFLEWAARMNAGNK